MSVCTVVQVEAKTLFTLVFSGCDKHTNPCQQKHRLQLSMSKLRGGRVAPRCINADFKDSQWDTHLPNTIVQVKKHGNCAWISSMKMFRLPCSLLTYKYVQVKKRWKGMFIKLFDPDLFQCWGLIRTWFFLFKLASRIFLQKNNYTFISLAFTGN